MLRGVAAIVVLAAGLLGPRPADANVMCRIFPIPCTYEGVAFRFTVVDAATRQPLADVHALAEWVLYGAHGGDGPVMVQDAVSGADGVLVFPAWGPVAGPRTGLILNHDPVITLFKPGYQTLLMTNHYPADTTETTRVRRFGQDGQTVGLHAFRGSPAEWTEQLRHAVFPQRRGGTSDEQFLRFRGPYLNRKQRIWAERDRVAPRDREPGQFLWNVEQDIKVLEGGRR